MIKNWFTKSEEEDSKSTNKQKDESPKEIKPASSITPSDLEGVEATDKFLAVVNQALENNNLKGVDYLEFIKSLGSLENIISDEATRYQSAFAVLKERGISRQKLLETATHYKSVLNTEEEKFLNALNKNLQVRVSDRGAEIESLNDNIKKKTKQIQQLNKQIEALQKEMVALEDQMKVSKEKANHTHAQFIASYNQKVSEIDNHTNKIKSYLQ